MQGENSLLEMQFKEESLIYVNMLYLRKRWEKLQKPLISSHTIIKVSGEFGLVLNKTATVENRNVLGF